MNIPDGATHLYNTSLYSAPMKKDGDDWFLFEDKRWIKVNSCNYQLMREKIIHITPTDTINHPTHYTQGKVDENNHYYINVAGLDEIDFYIIARLYGITDPNIQHTLKKLLAIGKRSGGKSESQDIQDCINQLKRKLEIDKLLDTTNKQL